MPAVQRAIINATTTWNRIQGQLPGLSIKPLDAYEADGLLTSEESARDCCVLAAREKTTGRQCVLKLIPYQQQQGCRPSQAGGISSSILAAADDEQFGPLVEARIAYDMSTEPSSMPIEDAFETQISQRPGAGVAPCASSGMAAASGGGGIRCLALRMPLAHGGNMRAWVGETCRKQRGRIPLHAVMKKWVQMVNGVRALHAHGLLHRDLKLENFLIDRCGMVRLTDFGLTDVSGDPSPCCRLAGTPWCMSPQRWRGEDDGEAGDWWALGVCLYELSEENRWPFKEGFSLWERRNGQALEAAVQAAVAAGKIAFHRSTPQAVRTLISGLLDPNPATRWGLKEVLSCGALPERVFTEVATEFPCLKEDMEGMLAVMKGKPAESAFTVRFPQQLEHQQACDCSGAAEAAAAAGPVAAAAQAGDAAAAGSVGNVRRSTWSSVALHTLGQAAAAAAATLTAAAGAAAAAGGSTADGLYEPLVASEDIALRELEGEGGGERAIAQWRVAHSRSGSCSGSRRCSRSGGSMMLLSSQRLPRLISNGGSRQASGELTSLFSHLPRLSSSGGFPTAEAPGGGSVPPRHLLPVALQQQGTAQAAGLARLSAASSSRCSSASKRRFASAVRSFFACGCLPCVGEDPRQSATYWYRPADEW